MIIYLLPFLFGVINVIDYFYVCINKKLCCLVIVEK